MNQFVKKKSWLVVVGYNKQGELVKAKLARAIKEHNRNSSDKIDEAMVEDRIRSVLPY